MARPLPRAYRLQQMARDAATVDRIIRAVGGLEAPTSAAGATAAGDPARLRGLPAVSRGTSGAIAGTDPLRALLSKER